MNQEYERFKRKQNQIHSLCDKQIQEKVDEDYLDLERPMSSLDLGSVGG